MSQRAKRPNRSDDGSVPVKRRKRTAAEEEEAATLAAQASSTWQPRSNDLKTIYNRTTTEAPAELFRKDLISAMKLPDSEPLATHEYWVIMDQWKQEWERGVQVPVNPDSLPEPSVTVTHHSSSNHHNKPHEFKLPKNKYIRITKDDNFSMDDHVLSNAPAQAEAACSYDLDECDTAWLKILNAERSMSGQLPINEDQLERVIEQFELTCWDKIQTILRNEEGLGIEYDENVICDVCRSPDSEEGNEMVFCDSCNICVHQACYGITRIPAGQWLCCTCQLSKRPKCVLCPNKGGAMKCTRSGQKWAHVSCALWIPEVSIGCVEKMEPITKISSIPTSRWALICVLCRERVGACIQCSVKTCKTAYHVTCAFKHGLEMRAIIEDENADDGVKLRSYCEKHSKSSKKEKNSGGNSGSDEDKDDTKRKKRKDMTSEEKNQARAQRLQEIEAEFYKHVHIKDLTFNMMDVVDNDALHHIYNYWRLKRKAGHNKPLLPPKSDDVDILSHKREQADIEKMKMFVQLRQDLERVRNLCYMVSRREKLSRSFFRLREQTFHKQVTVLDHMPVNLTNKTIVESVIEANHGPSIYDRLYSSQQAEDHTSDDFDLILSRIADGMEKSNNDNSIMNGGVFKDVKNNPYKKVYFNGASKRRSLYGSSSNNSSSDSSGSDERPKDNKENRILTTTTTTDDDDGKKQPQSKKKCLNVKKLNNNNKSRRNTSSSGDDNNLVTMKKWSGQLSRSRLIQVERELGYSGSDSDELMPIKTKTDTNIKLSSIYSDSDDDSSDDSIVKQQLQHQQQQNRLRTKAAVKEFSHKPSTSKPTTNQDVKKKLSKKDLTKKPSDLIVPQRQAAKKASENLKSTQQRLTTTTTTDVDSTTTTVKQVEDVVQKKIVKQNAKLKNCKDVKKVVDDVDEILAYVPQRQAAKKAAEHIKSGLGKVPDGTSSSVVVSSDVVKTPPSSRVLDKKDRKSSSNSSSSSSTSSSTDSTSSSSSDSDVEEPTRKSVVVDDKKSTVDVDVDDKKVKNAKDWPFLDKAPKPMASGSSTTEEESSGSSRPSSPRKSTSTNPRRRQSANQQNWVGDANVRARDISSAQSLAEEEKTTTDKQQQQQKEKVQSPIRVNKKLTSDEDNSKITNLEKEILERKAGKQQGSTKSTLDRLFGPPDSLKKSTPLKFVKNNDKSTVKENKEPIQVSPVRKSSPIKTNSKNLDEIFGQKSISHENKIIKDVVTETTDKPTTVVDDVDVDKKETTTTTTKSVETPPNHRSIFSPQHNNLYDFDNLDDGFGMTKDESLMIKTPLTFCFANTHLFKEDSKEDSARETLNLVEKLRMELSKKSTSCDVDDGVSVASSKNDNEQLEFAEQVVPNSIQSTDKNLEMRIVDDDDVVVTTTTKNNNDDHRCYSDSMVAIETNKNIPPIHTMLPDHNVTAQGDERWVPPSDIYQQQVLPTQPHYNMPSSYTNKNLTTIDLIRLPGQSDDLIVKNHQLERRNNIGQTSILHLDPTSSMDCMPSPSPYPDLIHPQAKWADSEIMPNRRSSSSSSAASTSSTCSRRNNEDAESVLQQQDVMMLNHHHHHLENLTYLPTAFPPNLDGSTIPQFEQTTFVSPVSLFPPPTTTFPPGGVFSAAPFPPPTSVLPTKPILSTSIDDVTTTTATYSTTSTCTATFTSSQHNMALTAAMVSLPPVVPLKEIEEVPCEVAATVTTSVKSSNGKKSPSKPTRTSARVTSQLNKSPVAAGKSPRQESLVNKANRVAQTPVTKNDVSRRSSVKSGRIGQVRGRGRGRGRGRHTSLAHQQSSLHNSDYDLNTIHNKLVGTVYDLDFDDDNVTSDMSDLKSMRERRKSIDHNTLLKNEPSIVNNKDVVNVTSPKFSSPTSTQKRFTDLRHELRPPTPVVDDLVPAKCDDVVIPAGKEAIFPGIVQPVLPGPVDMRTYSNSNFQQQYSETSNLLTAFATGGTTMENQDDIDEDFEKELHSALTKKTDDEATFKVNNTNQTTSEVNNIKVSLSDSRNQLKVKIKGPIANYSSTTAIIPTPIVDPIVPVVNSVSIASSVCQQQQTTSSGTSNLRRMRKKELLRQYWTQDMNMDTANAQPNSGGFLNAQPTMPPVNRTIITIPKAVASMTSIPTKDDYRDYRTGYDDVMETAKHNRKETKSRGSGGMSRELKQLDLLEEVDGNRRNNNVELTINRRRGRPPRPNTTPKIKIKIAGSNSIVSKMSDDVKKDRIRPPKKRLSTINMPSVEDLKRESMKFRKLVMADFDEGKEKRKKKDKSEKRKRKKKGEVQVETMNPTKLIIRIGKKEDVGDFDKLRTSGDDEDDVKTPIKLKLSRCQEGSGYVMCKDGEGESQQPALMDSVTTLPINKDCEVR